MPITEQQLLQILPQARQVAGFFVPALNAAMARFKIDSPVRMAAFIAQVGHESGQLTRMVENLNYSADRLRAVWPNRFDAALAARVARKPEQIANIVYAGRMGNTLLGDGWKYRGRGLIQLTGANNYRAAGAALGLDLVNHPELVEQPEAAALVAGWFWQSNGLNELADAGRIQDIGSIINTGRVGRVPHGAAERKALYDLAVRVLA
ncbi:MULTISPECIES: glycoside hydrolase family 19 protein [Pseudomonas chlororaphis group]|uniref:glycoside hydrolase family 19 protein n=1 Tax=Pseudomonas chlororaphis group TaxID=136842 RepID=UPI002096F028|nr:MULTISPECIES: glycoside hydrolase family 19 protein [Pseudomonas chlororaphis group]MCO7575363.1 glycoside hydrolase family 19 protein [Pseudomonas protegens]MCO7582534.1 glycoside hydrolase family 19 protein [Pseudomonas chlororaphis]MCO7599287.1 glycoside hydrolase family 19 protein [Pseudomonas chlororaphis]